MPSRALHSDVPRTEEVRIKGVGAVLALERALVLTVFLTGMPALKASSAGIPGVDLDSLNPRELSLVFYDLEKPIEAPRIETVAPLLDSLEVLECQNRSWRDRSHYLLSEDMVAVIPKPINLPASELL